MTVGVILRHLRRPGDVTEIQMTRDCCGGKVVRRQEIPGNMCFREEFEGKCRAGPQTVHFFWISERSPNVPMTVFF